MVSIPKKIEKDIIAKLNILYGTQANEILSEIELMINKYYDILNHYITGKSSIGNQGSKFTHKDIFLNTYANSIQEESITPLQTLYRFSEQFIQGGINGVHILPFYPWDTDRGFSVLNYFEVDPRYGNWEDFTALQNLFEKLMVDSVLNHASIDNPLIQRSLIGDTRFKDYTINFDKDEKPKKEDLLKITRARSAPVLTPYFILIDRNGKRWATFNKPIQDIKTKQAALEKTGWVWTTFSRPKNPDGTIATKQVDVNFKNPYSTSVTS